MQRLDLSHEDPAANLALDEALLMNAEQGGHEVIRFWRFTLPVVVIGRGSKIRDEVDVEFCKSEAIPILRRCSGGASIVAGPKCLMYSVVLNLNTRPELRNVDLAHPFVIGNLAAAVQQQQPEIQHQGICDLTLDRKKFSGNSLRVARNHLLYHGTLLEEVDPQFVSLCLRNPPRQPDYRNGRGHEEFITNIKIDSARFCDDLAYRYGATEMIKEWPEQEMKELCETRYALMEWNWRH